MNKFNIRSNSTRRLLLALIVVVLLLIGLIQPHKLLGFCVAYPLKFLFGQFYGIIICLICFYIISNLFSKVPSKIKFNIMIGFNTLIFGIMLLINSSLTKIDNSYIRGLSIRYIGYFKTSLRFNGIDILFKSSLGSGYIATMIFALVSELIGKIGAIIFSSFIVILGLGILIQYIKKEVKMYKKEEVKVVKEEKPLIEDTPVDKYVFGYEDVNEEVINPINGYEDANLDNNTTNIINPSLNASPKPFKEELDTTKQSSYKPFNVFTDEVIDEKQLMIDKVVNPTTSDKFSVFDEDFNTTSKKEETPSTSSNVTFDMFKVPVENITNNQVEDSKEEVINEEVPTYNSSFDGPSTFYEDENLDFDEPELDELDDNSHIFKSFDEVNKPTVLETRTTSTSVEDIFIIKGENYPLPSSSLLLDPIHTDISKNEEIAKENSIKLDEKLKSLGIDGHVDYYRIAPSFTRYYIAVADNVKVGAIPNVSRDLMMALSAAKINVLAPIPSTNYVGVDVPNVVRSRVSFKEIMSEIPYEKLDNKLLVNIGRDIAGKGIYLDLADCPHLLVAGTSGSGKSVCLNTIIMSLIMRARPDEVEMILFDPKTLEFQPYESIPHLMCPVINDPKEATIALKKVCLEMDKRYALLNKYSKKDIKAYNRYMEATGGVKLPYLVVIIDEFGDLMQQSKNEVEEYIRRLASLARSSGIHLVLATQRPSVDVITGVIKSNIASRIAFAVTDNLNSRVILDESGAEDLLGKGDMIMKLSGALTSVRAQGCFLEDVEIDAVADYLKSVSSQHFSPDFIDLKPQVLDFNKVEEYTDEDGSRDDEIYDKILDFLMNVGYVSNTLLKRKFAIGYSVAARMLDRLEDEGLVGPVNGNKARIVYGDKVKLYARAKDNQ